MGTLVYVPLTADGKAPASFSPSVPDPASKMAQDRETRAGHKEGIGVVLNAPRIVRHTLRDTVVTGQPFTPDLFASDVKEVRLTHGDMAEAIIAPVARYAVEHKDVSAADALAAILSGPIAVSSARQASASGAAGFAALATALEAAIDKARKAADAEADASTALAAAAEAATDTDSPILTGEAETDNGESGETPPEAPDNGPARGNRR